MKSGPFFGVAVAAILASGAPALAQAFPGLAPASSSLQTFRAEALRSDAYEIESSRMALQRSRDPRVRTFARQMIRDHETTTRSLLPEGTSLNAGGNVVSDKEGGPFDSPIALLTAPLTIPVNFVGRTFEGRSLIDNEPSTPGRRVALDPRRQEMLAQLDATRGRTFNATYARQQSMAHRETVALYEGFAREGADETGRTFAGQVLPSLQRHLGHAQDLDERYAAGTPAF